jgi:hypothetical protein
LGIVGLLKAIVGHDTHQLTKWSVSVTKLTPTQTVSPNKNAVLGVSQSCANTSICGGEGWGSGKRELKFDDNDERLPEREPVSNSSWLCFAGAPDKLLDSSADEEFERTE